MSVLVIIGGQYGSEGKGAIVYHLAARYNVHVRVGGPNAGHTFFHEGKLWKMRAIPCGWVNPRAKLVIGAGAVVDWDVLIEEVDELEAAGYVVRERLYIDERAALISRQHQAAEDHLGPAIGSTKSGTGMARIARIRRDPQFVNFARCMRAGRFRIVDTLPMLSVWRRTDNILLEGTQGSGLDLVFGCWPYVTSHGVSAAQMLADVGLPPKEVEILLVVRTYPIRVGGNSGPLPHEITWDGLSKRLGREVVEYTTVTGSRRRVAAFDWAVVEDAVRRNQPDAFAVTFLDYFPGVLPGTVNLSQLSSEAKCFLHHLQARFRIPVRYIGTGRKEGGAFCVIEQSISQGLSTA